MPSGQEAGPDAFDLGARDAGWNDSWQQDAATGDGSAPDTPHHEADGAAPPTDGAAGEAGAAGDTALDAWECPPGSPCDLPYAGFCDEGVCDEAGTCQPHKLPGCCLADDDCGTGDTPAPPAACQVARCVSYQCQLLTIPGCCQDDAACDDAVACTVDTCSLPAGRCASCPQACGCEGAPATPWSVDFSAGDLGSQGFTVVDYEPQDSVGWHVDTTRWRSPPASLYLGDPSCRTYDTGALDADCQPVGGAARVHLALYTPPLSVPAASAGQVAIAWVWADVEPLSHPGAVAATEPDVLRVFVEDLVAGGLSWARASTLDVGKSTAGAWLPLVVDLSPWRGGTVRLRFEFDTLDGLANHHEGLYLDDLAVQDRCAGGCCTQDSQCEAVAGADPCRVGRCVGASTAVPGVCVAAPRAPGGVCDACDPGALCDDGDPCTNDGCGPQGVCEHTTFCCLERIGASFSFELGLSGWFTEGAEADDVSPGVAAVASWHAVPGDSPAGGQMAWLGRLDTATYDTGAPVRVGLRSAPLALPTLDGGHSLAVRFWVRLETEWDDAPTYFNPGGVDRLSLALAAGPGPGGQAQAAWTEVWSSDALQGTTHGDWVPVIVPLPAWTPQGARLRFLFDTVDATDNDHFGPAVDQVELVARCP